MGNYQIAGTDMVHLSNKKLLIFGDNAFVIDMVRTV